MQGISDIKIIGIDERRPPRIRKEPYIDLFFQLSHKVPEDWLQEFSSAQPEMNYDASMNSEDCLYIQTWVRTPDEIPAHLQALKTLVTACNTRYINNIEAKLRDQQRGTDSQLDQEGPQGHLNRVIAALNFGDN